MITSSESNSPENFFSELEQSRESLDFALQSAGIGTWDIDLATNSVHASSVMLDLWGMTAEEFDGDRMLLQTKVHPEDVLKMKASIDHAIRTQTIYDFEYRVIPYPGKIRWIRSRGRVTYDAKKNPLRFSGVVIDITSRKEKEELQALAQKERERFLIVAGHELRTPLTGLQLQLQVMENELKEKFPDALKDNRLFGSICRQKEQIWRLVRIIDNICEHSELAENSVQLQLEQHDLVSIISGLVNRFLTLANVNHNIAFTFQSKVESLPGKWDKLRIEHAILNLMSNALRFGKRTPIEISIDHVDNFAHIFVRDNGPGISQDDQKNIFGRVGSGLTEMSGMGLGLHITEQIVRSHGGKVLVHSELGNGTVFTVVLPCIR